MPLCSTCYREISLADFNRLKCSHCNTVIVFHQASDRNITREKRQGDDMTVDARVDRAKEQNVGRTINALEYVVERDVEGTYVITFRTG